MKYLLILFTLTTIISCSNEPRENAETREYGKKMEEALDKLETEKKEKDRISKDPFQLDNETTVLTFKTKNGKRLLVCRDNDNKYLVYRFGAGNVVELQYPEKLDKTSFQKFDYSSYFRPGGIDNLGMNLDYLSFINNGFRYVIYKTYVAESNEDAVGVRIIDLKTKKETDIVGDFKTFSGGFPEEVMDKVNQSEELFD